MCSHRRSTADGELLFCLDWSRRDALREALRTYVVHRWRPNDLLVWDNRAVVHRATPYDATERRELWRLSISLGSAQTGPTP